MVPRARRSSPRGLLLVEAVLSAVVIAVGLVFVSRGLANQLKAMETVAAYDRLLTLARRKWLELEAGQLSVPPMNEEQPRGSFGSVEEQGPDSAFQWAITASRRPKLGLDSRGEPLMSEVTLTVSRLPQAEDGAGGSAGDPGRRGPVVIQSAVWPSDWVPEEWLD